MLEHRRGLEPKTERAERAGLGHASSSYQPNLRENSRAGKRLRVEPKNDLMRQILRHPTAGFFRGAGAAEWPDDKFTHRRLKDGDIKLAADQRR